MRTFGIRNSVDSQRRPKDILQKSEQVRTTEQLDMLSALSGCFYLQAFIVDFLRPEQPKPRCNEAVQGYVLKKGNSASQKWVEILHINFQ